MTAILAFFFLLSADGQSAAPRVTQTETGCDFRILLTNSAGVVYPWVINLKVSLEDRTTGKVFFQVEPKTGTIDACDTQFRVFRIRVEGTQGPNYVVRGDFSNHLARTKEVRISYPGTVEEDFLPPLGCEYFYRLTDGESNALQGRMETDGGPVREAILTNTFGRIIYVPKLGTHGEAVFSSPGFEDLRMPWRCDRTGTRIQTIVLKAAGGSGQ